MCNKKAKFTNKTKKKHQIKKRKDEEQNDDLNFKEQEAQWAIDEKRLMAMMTMQFKYTAKNQRYIQW